MRQGVNGTATLETDEAKVDAFGIPIVDKAASTLVLMNLHLRNTPSLYTSKMFSGHLFDRLALKLD
jgi:hypothetical protein